MSKFLHPKEFIRSKNYLSMLQINPENSPLVVLFSKESEVRLLLETIVKSWDFQICEAANETDLIQIAETKNPALVLFDLSLSIDEDLQTLRRVRKMDGFEKLPILALSGHARFADSIKTLNAGADEYLLKPINFDHLEDSIKKYCADETGNPETNFGVVL